MYDGMMISGPSFGPVAGGAPRHMVMLLHGYGADGNDLLGLAPHWARLLPDTEFIAPHAPFPCEAAPYGRQWFGFEGRSPSMLLGETQTAAGILNAFIDGALAKRGLAEADLALAGFSQGTMMALYVAPRRARAVAAVVGYSGSLIAPEMVAGEAASRPRFLLVHGDADPVVAHDSLRLATEALTAAGMAVQAMTRPGLAHAIDEEGLAAGGRFIADNFRRTAAAP